MIKNLVFSICFAISVNIFARDSAKSIWIDVRTLAEYEQEHRNGAVNIPFTQIKQRIAEVTEDKQATIHLYCAAGIRAEIAKTTLQGIGYENVINEGGLNDVKVAQ